MPRRRWLFAMVMVQLVCSSMGGGEDLHADLGDGSGVGTSSPWGFGSPSAGVGGGQQQQPRLVAQGADDPRAPSVQNSIAMGKGLYEGRVGKQSVIEVIPRDTFGDGKKCFPGMFMVQAATLTAAQDEDTIVCEGKTDPGGNPCTSCGKMTVCFIGAENGPCRYAYTPTSPGFIRIKVGLNGPGGAVEIQGSPFRAHVSDGGMFVPGMSFFGYMGVFFTGIGGGLLLLAVLFSIAWRRWQEKMPQTEDDLEMQRLEEIASELEMTHQSREDRARLLQELSLKIGGRDRSDSNLTADDAPISPAVHEDGLRGWGGRMKEAAMGIGSVGYVAVGAARTIQQEGAGVESYGGWGSQDMQAGEVFSDDLEEGEGEEGGEEDELLGGIDALWRGLNLHVVGGGGSKNDGGHEA